MTSRKTRFINDAEFVAEPHHARAPNVLKSNTVGELSSRLKLRTKYRRWKVPQSQYNLPIYQPQKITETGQLNSENFESTHIRLLQHHTAPHNTTQLLTTSSNQRTPSNQTTPKNTDITISPEIHVSFPPVEATFCWSAAVQCCAASIRHSRSSTLSRSVGLLLFQPELVLTPSLAV
jgi:hypothetical protein